jgi:hypothetical protein
MSFKIEMILNNADKIQKAMEEVAYTSVYVGIPAEKSSRKDEAITNAELAYVHTHGSPVNGIPPRPFLKPSIKKNMATVAILQKQMIAAGLKGDKTGVNRAAELLGMHSRDNAKKYITEGTNLAPNSPAVYARKLAKSKKQSDATPKPLIDTAALLNSISYVVDNDRRGRRQ